MTLPKAKSLSPLVAAITDVTNSGREVPIETTVRPISWSLTPKLLAISDAEFTTKFPPNIIAAIPIIEINIDLIIVLFFSIALTLLTSISTEVSGSHKFSFLFFIAEFIR